MDCSNRTSRTSARYYQYTVQQLLHCRSLIQNHFDLSKLSFDAVRAGIVPALSECAMAPREFSAQDRRRGWSSQTTDTEEFIVYQGNRQQAPIRQPNNAPTELLVQKDQGFAHFLKTHSSPNHQRVTAGGRIVPMEKRPAPPKFSLPPKDTNSMAGLSSSTQQTEPYPQLDLSDMGYRAGLNNNVGSPRDVVTEAPGAISANIPASSRASNRDVASAQSVLEVSQAALDSNLLLQNQLMSITHAPSMASMYPGIPSMASYLPGYAPQYQPASPYWSYSGQFAQPMIQTSLVPFVWDPVQMQKMSLQDTYDQTNEFFGMLDQQLKDLDKYRATHNREHDLVQQRMVIVEQRFAAKDQMRRIRAAINLCDGIQPSMPTTSQPDPGQSVQTALTNIKPKLNVEAAAYVPRAASQVNAHIQSKVKITAPPVKPETPTPSPSTPAVSEPASPELAHTDPWGSRVGQPPALLERQQSEMAESLASGVSSPSGKGSENQASQSGSGPSIQSADELVSETGSDSLESISTKFGRAPVLLEADYEMQLDAMRKPVGQSTLMQLSDGKLHNVEGQGLQRPPSADMNVFERSYWSRKAENMVDAGKENSGLSFGGDTSAIAQNDMIPSYQYLKQPSSFTNDSRSRGILAEISSGAPNSGLGSHAEQKEWDAAIRKLQREAESRQVGDSVKVVDNGSSDQSMDRPQQDADQEALSNKAYSSVSLQNVHAISSLPRSLDGAIEATLRKVQSPGRISNKTKSPKTLFRMTGDAWYGPFRRNFFDGVNKEERTE